MENASKALIIAGETLIGLIVVSLIVYAASTFGSFSANMNDKMSEKTVVTFNQHYWEYQGRIDISAEEIASIINFSKQSNDSYELSFQDSSVYWVDVYIEGKRVFDNNAGIININESEYNSMAEFKKKIKVFLEKYNTSYFSCCTSVPHINGKSINFKSNDDDIKYNSQTKMINRIDFHILKKIDGEEFGLQKAHTLDEYSIDIDTD